MFMLALASFQAAEAATPAIPPIAPPPMVRMDTTMPLRSVPDLPPVLMDIRVTGGGTVLYSDTLRVGAPYGANFSQSRNEAFADNCPGYRFNGTSLNVRLARRSTGDREQSFSVDVNWIRPAANAQCANSGNRGVSLNQTFQLEPQKSITLTGDGDLRVEIRRR